MERREAALVGWERRKTRVTRSWGLGMRGVGSIRLDSGRFKSRAASRDLTLPTSSYY
jgi:hypothetical protein